jgi:hypothetical protein
MAEIKSTLDLVMEKTKHLSLSAEEKTEMKLQEELKKVPGYVERILDRTLNPEELRGLVDALEQQYRERIRLEIAQQMGQALDLSSRTDPLIAALELLVEPAWTKLLDQIRNCRSEYRQAKDAAGRTAEHRVLTQLAHAGIKGPAVVAKLESDPSWQVEDRELRQSCEELLEELRETLSSVQQVAGS